MPTRRGFLQTTFAGAAASAAHTGAGVPWYRRACRWGQTTITERDPVRYDIPWWREYWKRTQVQGVIINAGGIVAYYPSKFPLQHRAEFLNGRDLYGELARAAHEDGLAVLARMDSNRVAEDFFRAHPDWFAREPIRMGAKEILGDAIGIHSRQNGQAVLMRGACELAIQIAAVEELRPVLQGELAGVVRHNPAGVDNHALNLGAFPVLPPPRDVVADGVAFGDSGLPPPARAPVPGHAGPRVRGGGGRAGESGLQETASGGHSHTVIQRTTRTDHSSRSATMQSTAKARRNGT